MLNFSHLYDAIEKRMKESPATSTNEMAESNASPQTNQVMLLPTMEVQPELGNYFRQHVDQVKVLHECAESALTDNKNQRLVLFIDQFEEVFTQISNEDRTCGISQFTDSCRNSRERTCDHPVLHALGLCLELRDLSTTQRTAQSTIRTDRRDAARGIGERHRTACLARGTAH